MKKNLVKMRVCLGFDCNPRVDVISYEDELSPEGKAYQSTRGVRNEKTLVDFGQTWLKMSDVSNTPYWDAYVIVDGDNASIESLAEKAKELQSLAMESMRKSLEDETARFNAIGMPDSVALQKVIAEKLNPQEASSSSARMLVPVAEFKSIISANVRASGKENADRMGFEPGKWEEFFEKTLTPEILSLLMKGLPVLKFVGDSIEFQSNEMYEQAVNAVSAKVAGDVFARFVEVTNAGNI